MQRFIVAKVAAADWAQQAQWHHVLPPLHVEQGWPTDPESYKRVPSLAISLAGLQSKSTTRPTSVVPPLYIDPDRLEPERDLVDSKEQHDIALSFRQFKSEVEAEGLLVQGKPMVFAVEFARVAALFVGFALTYTFAQNWWQTLASAAFLGLFWHQIVRVLAITLSTIFENLCSSRCLSLMMPGIPRLLASSGKIRPLAAS